MTCCNEYRCRRKTPYKIRLGPFTHRWYLLTHYHTRPGHPELLVADQKHDIHDELIEALLDAGWLPPAMSPDDPALEPKPQEAPR